MNEMDSVKVGDIFRHYKGSIMQVDNIATHTETNEEMVVYHHIKDQGTKFWTRPMNMWFDKVEKDGKTYSRFTKLSHIEKDSEDKNIEELVGCIFVSWIDCSNVIVTDIMRDPANDELYIFFKNLGDNTISVLNKSEWNKPVEDSDGNIGPRYFIRSETDFDMACITERASLFRRKGILK